MIKISDLLEKIGATIIDAGGLDIRDVDAGEEPFLYSSGNRGPGYVMIKGLVGQPEVLQYLTWQLALKMVEAGVDKEFDFIAANATGGMVPGWQLRNDLERLTGEEIPYVYVRETRKVGGHKEHITGDRNNPLMNTLRIDGRNRALVFEELVNFAETTTNSAKVLREADYRADVAGTILSYQNPKAQELLDETGVRLTHLIGLPDLINVAETLTYVDGTKRFKSEAVQSYRDFLADPVKWQLDRGYELPEK